MDPASSQDFDLPIIRFKCNQFNAWMEGAEASQERRQHSGENTWKGRDPNGDGFLASGLGSLFSNGVQMRQGSTGVVEGSLSESSEFDAMPVARQQFHAEAFLQHRQCLAHAGLRHADIHRCGGKTSRFSDCNQATELSKVHSSKAYIRNLRQ